MRQVDGEQEVCLIIVLESLNVQQMTKRPVPKPNNRRTQSLFICERCGHTDNADRNAVLVIKKRAIELIKNTATVLSIKDKGRGVTS